jgi:hypothetical protein
MQSAAPNHTTLDFNSRFADKDASRGFTRSVMQQRDTTESLLEHARNGQG